MHQRDVCRVVQTRAFGQQAHLRQNRFDFLMPCFGQMNLFGFLINPKITFGFRIVRGGLNGLRGQLRRHGIELLIQLRVVIRRPRDNQRRARFID